MDAGELHRLGKRLIALSRMATSGPDDPAMTPGELAVLEDVLTHRDSSVTQIHQRTGFVQSHVSASVARLRARGLVETSVDPSDGRRSRVRATDTTTRAITHRGGRTIDTILDQTVGDPETARRIATLLNELADLIR